MNLCKELYFEPVFGRVDKIEKKDYNVNNKRLPIDGLALKHVSYENNRQVVRTLGGYFSFLT